MLTQEQYFHLKQYAALSEIQIEQAEEYKSSFNHHIMAMQWPLKVLIARGDFPYNSEVAKEARKYPEFADMEQSTLDHYVYMGQQYRSGKILHDYFEETKSKITQEGYQPISETDFNQLVGTRKEVMVYTERAKEKYIKARLIIDGEGRFFWVQPRFTRRGYFAAAGDYVKPIEVAKKKTIVATDDQRIVATGAQSLLFS